ncbi:hypothetical protein GCU60_15200 [Blastococcus saxobsidens]|uniref:DUF559 domain-containing protein n=1 Tax=Blastococcus saxobsidens TaxID=138336 RepID=A0A6L9W4Q5_9ACTN|nr:hypothetical protein [Blastococcus saxobsidens]NEK87086.1 hypothetical protein [Blastococcus saxobsidens]
MPTARGELVGGVDLVNSAVLRAARGRMVALVFDGAAFHGDLAARERDLRRDSAPAALGWMVLRFGFRDVTRRPQVCRAQIRAAYRQWASMAPEPRAPGPGMRT